MANMKQAKRMHIVAFPYPLQGHIIPMLALVKRLASMEISATLVLTESCHERILRANKGIDPVEHARIDEGYDIFCATISDGLPVNIDRSLYCDEFEESLRTRMVTHVEDFFNRSSTEYSHIIADTFFPWPEYISKKFHIPHISFWTEAAMVFSIWFHWELLEQHNHLPFPKKLKNDEEIIDYIPGLSALKAIDLPSYLQENPLKGPSTKLAKLGFQSARAAQCILATTIHEMEEDTIKALEDECGKRFYSVGPLLPSELSLGTSMWEESDCTTWLDNQAPRSVLYVSFGSFAFMSGAQLAEIAMGLLMSNRPFVWALRPNMVASGINGLLPRQFLNGKMKHNGLVVSWCCQRRVLNHESVCGFITHLGWNSVIDSIWAGVPMLCFPLFTDQFTNRRLVVEEWRIGMNLGCMRGYQDEGSGVVVKRDEICNSIQEFMTSNVQKKLKQNLLKKRQVVRKAVVDENGSSNANLRMFTEKLMQDHQAVVS